MDFIKKHYEKVLVVVALVVLIASAGYLAFRVTALSEEVAAAQLQLKPKVKRVEPGDISSYTNAIASLQSPVLWQKRYNMFATGGIVQTNAARHVIEHPEDPIAVVQIIRQPFKLIFKAYTGQGENFQVDFLTGRRSFFVRKVGDPVADRFGNSGGYTTTKFEYKTLSVFNAALGRTNDVDVSELTIQHAGEDPILMPLNKVVEEKEPVAVVQCAKGDQQFQIRRGQDFDCGTNSYNVVDINSTQVIIVDKLTKEKRTIKPAVGR